MTATVEHTRSLSPSRVGLSSANSISLDSHGRIYIGDGSDHSIKAFGADGVQGAVIGTAGAGPGEFVALLSAGVLADTVFGWDGTSNRLTMFSGNGKYARTMALHRVGRPPYSRMRAMDDSLLVASGWVLGVHERPLVEVFDRHGRSVGTMMDVERMLSPANPELLRHTFVFADGRDGVVFSTLHGYDTIMAYSPEGRLLGAGRINLENHEPVLDLSRLLARTGKSLQRPDGSWAQDRHFAVLKLVALDDGLVAVQYGLLQFEHGTDLISEGGPVVVMRLGADGVIRRVTQVESPGALLGRTERGHGLILRWSGSDLEKLDLFHLTVAPEKA
ncbi:MAG TPA: hypothetical protein VGB24_00490 [Longimicrobium sp.]|uniref:hypothetical protein n=1 Tax=Longimicrobium sp. TaxID=2029185 RepID=UPI002EDA431E